MGAGCRAIEELYQLGGLPALRQQLKERLEYPGAAEPSEPLPHAVPLAVFSGKGSSGYAVHGEVVKRLKELTVVVTRHSPAGLRGVEHLKGDRPIPLRHSRQHVRLPVAGHAVSRTMPDSGIG